MKKTEADVCDCLVCQCPYCEKEIIEVGSSLVGWNSDSDFESEGKLDCPHCSQEFEYFIDH